MQIQKHHRHFSDKHECFARSEQKLTDAGRPGPPEAYLSPFFVPSGDLDVPEGFSKNGDTLAASHGEPKARASSPW